MSSTAEEHVVFMGEALAEARAALRRGEVPVGCVLVLCGGGKSPPAGSTDGGTTTSKRIISCGSNKTNELKNATMHAEVVCINKLLDDKKFDASVIRECDLYVTCEPCIMCAAALSAVGVRHVYFGCRNDRFGGNGSILSVHEASEFGLEHSYGATDGIGREDAVDLFKLFYSQENSNAPEPKRRKKCEAGDEESANDESRGV